MNDMGPNPYVVNIEELTVENGTFRTVVWTGKYLQTTVMSIEPGDDIGLEVHDDHDQFLRIEAGQAEVHMGINKENMQTWQAGDDYAIFVPAGVWHNIVNTGDEPLKVYSIYSPPEHAHGTVHLTKAAAEAAEN